MLLGEVLRVLTPEALLLALTEAEALGVKVEDLAALPVELPDAVPLTVLLAQGVGRAEALPDSVGALGVALAEAMPLALDVPPCRSEALCSAVEEALRLACALSVPHRLPVLDTVCVGETDGELLVERVRVGVPVRLPEPVPLGVREGEREAERDKVVLRVREGEADAESDWVALSGWLAVIDALPQAVTLCDSVGGTVRVGEVEVEGMGEGVAVLNTVLSVLLGVGETLIDMLQLSVVAIERVAE